MDIRISGASLNAPGNNNNRPDVIAKPRVLGEIGPGRKWIDVSAFAAPAPGTFGTTARNILNGPRFVNLDFSVFRKFRMTERLGAEFRFESFNFTNTPHFERPGRDNGTFLGNADFGEVTSAMSDQRQIQFGLKIIF